MKLVMSAGRFVLRVRVVGDVTGTPKGCSVCAAAAPALI
jgi:hypothetical protein